MPGTLSVRPIQANISHVTSKVLGMDPYCLIRVGNRKEHSSVCYNGGKHPHWEDTIVLDIGIETKFSVELKDKTMLFSDANIGKIELELNEIDNQKDSFKWYILMHNNEPAGEILMETFLDSEDINVNLESREEDKRPQMISQEPDEGDNAGEDELDKYRTEENPNAKDQMWGINEVDPVKPSELHQPKVYNLPQAIPHFEGSHEFPPSQDFGQQEGIDDIDFRFTVEKPHFVDSPQAIPYQASQEKARSRFEVPKKSAPVKNQGQQDLGYYQPQEYKNLVYKTDIDIIPQNVRDFSI